jgi:hypothetical protein
VSSHGLLHPTKLVAETKIRFPGDLMNYKTLIGRILIASALSMPFMATLMVANLHVATAAEPETGETSTNRLQSTTSVTWDPLALVNPSRAVTIELSNTTNLALEYLITTHTNFRNLAPGETVRLIVEPSDLPVYVNINTTESAGLKYLLKVNSNKVMVDLKLTEGESDTTLNIQKKGGIYVY